MKENGLQIFWYLAILGAIAFYGILDGFDLGVGAMHLFTKKDEERRTFLNAIGPVWDGNEVWLIIVGGGLLSGFPFAYATLFSALYIPLIALVFALIFRAVAIEFRSKLAHPLWRKSWDFLFSLGSIFIALGSGIVLGNLVQGISLDANHNYTGTALETFLTPYPLFIGLLTLSLFMMHGALFLFMKTEGQLQKNVKKWAISALFCYCIFFTLSTIFTLIFQEHMILRFRTMPALLAVPLLAILAPASIVWQLHKNRPGWAFLSSCATIATLITLYAIGNFPNLVRSSILPEQNSLTIANSIASDKTLAVLTVIAAIGTPLVIAYGFYIYHTFRGKVKLEPTSY